MKLEHPNDNTYSKRRPVMLLNQFCREKLADEGVATVSSKTEYDSRWSLIYKRGV
jgi:hypothetical protein